MAAAAGNAGVRPLFGDAVALVIDLEVTKVATTEGVEGLLDTADKQSS
jgi:hypothetical protein